MNCTSLGCYFYFFLKPKDEDNAHDISVDSSGRSRKQEAKSGGSRTEHHVILGKSLTFWDSGFLHVK